MTSPSSLQKRIGANLAYLRKNKGIGQECLAQVAGVSQSIVSHWEVGRRGTTIFMLQKLAEFYGVTIDEIVNTDLSDTKEVTQ